MKESKKEQILIELLVLKKIVFTQFKKFGNRFN
jgi:hypothetical protein